MQKNKKLHHRVLNNFLIVCLLAGVGSFSVVYMDFSFTNQDCLLLQQQNSPLYALHPPPLDSSNATRSTVIAKKKDDNELTSIGWKIVTAAYNRTWGQVECPQAQPWKDCLKDSRSNGGKDDKSWPWWFQTMLRDAHFSHEKWHWLSFRNNLNFCSMEKIGTKQFRRLQCLVNYHIDDTVLRPGNHELCYWDVPRTPTSATTQTKSGTSTSANDDNASTEDKRPIRPQTAVFLRDPLQRFLSGFLDKCVSKKNREREPHCEPAQIFMNKDNERLVHDILDGDPQQFFEAYVDTMPLKWNMHFFPQGMYCDGLARTIDEFDFVGKMTSGPQFYEDLYDFGQKFGVGSNNELRTMMDKVFDVSRRRSKPNTTKVHTETSASTQVEKYYNAKTVRRVLEYVSVDYVALGLKIPTWAEEMLLQDQSGYGIV